MHIIDVEPDYRNGFRCEYGRASTVRNLAKIILERHPESEVHITTFGSTEVFRLVKGKVVQEDG